MFADTPLESLPEGFNLVHLTNLIRCSLIFSGTNIRSLPNDFALPDSVVYCVGMFYRCRNLETIPDSFILGDNVEDCSSLFDQCNSLSYIPSNFRIPPKVKTIDSMFESVKYVKLNNLIIPEGVTNIFEAFRNVRTIEGSITIQGNPTEYTRAFQNTAQNATQNFVVNYTSNCTNIEGIKETVENGKVQFNLVQ